MGARGSVSTIRVQRRRRRAQGGSNRLLDDSSHSARKKQVPDGVIGEAHHDLSRGPGTPWTGTASEDQALLVLIYFADTTGKDEKGCRAGAVYAGVFQGPEKKVWTVSSSSRATVSVWHAVTGDDRFLLAEASTRHGSRRFNGVMDVQLSGPHACHTKFRHLRINKGGDLGGRTVGTLRLTGDFRWPKRVFRALGDGGQLGNLGSGFRTETGRSERRVYAHSAKKTPQPKAESVGANGEGRRPSLATSAPPPGLFNRPPLHFESIRKMASGIRRWCTGFYRQPFAKDDFSLFSAVCSNARRSVSTFQPKRRRQRPRQGNPKTKFLGHGARRS